MVTFGRKPNSGNSVVSAHEIIIILLCIQFSAFQQLVNASCISFNGQIGECVKLEECHSAVVLSEKGVNPGFCSFEAGTVCCTDHKSIDQVEAVPYKEAQLSYIQNWSPTVGASNTNTKGTFGDDSNTQRKKHILAKPVENSNYGKKKINSDFIEEPYKFETPVTYYTDGEVTYKPVGRPSRTNSQNEEGNFLPPGQAKKKSCREEKTTEYDYYYDRVTKKPSRGPNRKGSNKRTGNGHELNSSRKWAEVSTEWSEQGGKGSWNSHIEHEHGYESTRTTPKRSDWGQERYTSTRQPDYFGSESESIYAGNEDTYSNPKPSRRPRPQTPSKFYTNRPDFQESLPQGSNFPIYPHDSNSGNSHPNYPQGSNSGNSRPNYPQGSNSGNSRPIYPQGSNSGNSRPNYPQDSSFENNNPTFRPGSQNRKSISEQKCEEYSKQVTENITGLPLTTNPDPVVIPVRKCITPQQLIVGGENTTLGEFPHMAAVGFRDRNKKQIAWNCGGALISERFVMTAGHCTSTSSGRPVKVRLGEYNLVKNDDGAYPVDYAVIDIIIHPEYRPPSKYNDIALLKLSRKVTFFKHIRPACLYSQTTFSASKAIATGWGRRQYDGTTSEILQKVVLNIVDNHTCNRLYKVNVKTEVLSRGIVDTQICAGELTGGKDTCQGDSGGPLSITNTKCIHHVIGITSFGKSCALPNSTGVYTRVSSYIPWIESVIWSTSYN